MRDGPIGLAVATSQRWTEPSAHPVAKAVPSGRKASDAGLIGLGWTIAGEAGWPDRASQSRAALVPVAPRLTVRRSRPSGLKAIPATRSSW